MQPVLVRRRRSAVHIDDLLAVQAGVVSRAQATRAGLDRWAVGRRVRGGRWRVLHPGVYLAADRDETDEVRLRAAVLWAGDAAVAHGLSAAWWLGLVPTLRHPVTVTVPRRCAPRSRPGVAVRRRDLARIDRVERYLVPVTDVPLTVLEAAVALGPDGGALLDRALQRHVRFPAVHRAHCRGLGRHGSPTAGALLRAAADRGGSEAERRLVGLLRRAGVTGWVRHHRADGYEIDVAFPAARVAVEVDGWAWHVDAERFQADRRRQNDLTAAGWTVLRFTWHDLTARPDDVVARIRRAVIAVSARSGADPAPTGAGTAITRAVRPA